MTNPLQPEEGMMGELKPCPFCGGEAFKDTGYQGALVSITCGGCWVGIPHDADESEDETVAAWNTRTSAPPVQQGVGAREGWEPIETAPKDGTLLLICEVDEVANEARYEVAYWVDKWGTYPLGTGSFREEATCPREGK